MKRFHIAMLSIFMLLFGSMLAACKNDKSSLEFTQSELYVSVGEQVDLEQYVKESKLKLSDVDIKIENKDVISLENTTLSAKQSGSSYIYATYQNNLLASLNVIVKAKFDAPTNFNLAEDGTLTWNVVSGRYKGDSENTKAARYLIEGARYYGRINNIGETLEKEDIYTTVQTNSFVFSNAGVYIFQVTALATGNFENSEKSEEQQFSFGTMPVPDAESFTWDRNGIVSWEGTEDALYAVAIDGKVISYPRTGDERDISRELEAINPGTHVVRLYVVHPEYQVMPSYIDAFAVTKLEAPTAEYVYDDSFGGKLVITTNEYVEKYIVSLKDRNTSVVTELEFENDASVIETTLDGVDAGLYDVSVTAKPVEGYYFESNKNLDKPVYKLHQAQMLANGQSAQNGNILKLKSLTENDVSSRSIVKLNQEEVGEYGVVDGVSNFDVRLPEVGVYTLNVTIKPTSGTNFIDGKQVYVVNATATEDIEVVKLASPEGVLHSYTSNKSVLTCDTIANASKYNIYVLVDDVYEKLNEDLYTMEVSDGKVKISFVDALENMDLVDEYGVYSFKLEARDDTRFSIDSFTEKMLTKLGVAESVERENTDKTLRWTAVENADNYSSEIYTITKELYLAGDTDIDTSGLTPIIWESPANRYTFSSVGYYLVKVTALTENANDFLPATESYDVLVCAAEKLQMGDLTLAQDGEGKYYLAMQNLEHFRSFEISLDGDVLAEEVLVSSTSQTKYLLTETFNDTTKTYEFSVVVSSQDDLLYLDSDAKVLSVHKLRSAAIADIDIEEWQLTPNASLNIATTRQLLTIDAIEGAKGVQLWEGVNSSGGRTTPTATYHLENKSNVELTFKYYGSQKSGESFVVENEAIYLDSEEETFTFNRIANLTDYKFYAGSLVLTNISTSISEEYVVVIFSKDVNGNLQQVALHLGDGAKFVYGEQEYVLSADENFTTNEGSEVTIDLDAILEAIEDSALAPIKQFYNQSTKFGFVVYVKPNSATDSIMSNLATLEIDSSANVVFIERIQAPVVTYQISGGQITLSWDPVSVDTGVGAATQYQIIQNGAPVDITGLTSVTYDLSEFNLSTYYSLSVKTENPYYIDSNSSNIVRIYRLSAVKDKKLKLISSGEYDGKLEYQLLSSEQDFVDYVLVNGTEHNTSGKIEIGDKVSITLQVIGKTQNDTGITTQYIDSESVTWNLAEMSELIDVVDETISYEDGVISWGKFAEGKNLASLKYVLMFKDSDDHVAVFETTETSVNMNTNQTLYNTVASLKQGDITLKVYAHLETYSVVANVVNAKVYYADAIELANGNEECNYHQYSQVYSMKKLTTPVVASVEFDYNSDLSQATAPTIHIVVTGNYGNTAKFNVGIDGILLKTIDVAKNNDKYEFDITPVEYENKFAFGESYEISICALSSTDIPSSIGRIQIVRAGEVVSVDFAEDEGKLLPKAIVNVTNADMDRLAGKIVLFIDYEATGENLQREYILVEAPISTTQIEKDLTDFIATNMPNGGTIKLGAIINSHSDDTNKIYILSCSEFTESEEEEVLASITNSDLTRLSGGFEIDATINAEDTEYVIANGGQEYLVLREDDRYYFEFDNAWANGIYSLNVYAQEAGKIRSMTTTLNVELSRIASVSEVTLQRSVADKSQVTLSWNAVVGATKYIVRLYSETYQLLYQTEVTANYATVAEIFGEDYSNVFAEGIITSINQDTNVKISVAAVGDSAANNDSKEYIFNATIKGNDFTTQDFYIDDFGIINIDMPEQGDYAYKYVDVSGDPISGINWEVLEANSDIAKLNASHLTNVGRLYAEENFRLYIKKLGSDTASSLDNAFVLDSTKFNSMGRDNNFQTIKNIVNVGYNARYPSSLTFTLSKNSFNRVYVGTTEDAIFNGAGTPIGDGQRAKDGVVEIELDERDDKGDNTWYYTYDLYAILDILRKNFDVPVGNASLYFWLNLVDIVADREINHACSQVASIEFEYTDDIKFDKVEKYTRQIDENTTSVDYHNVYALFDADTDPTLGVIVKVIDATGVEIIFFVDIIDLQDNTYYDSSETLAVNITTIFERPEMIDRYGEFIIDFARVQLHGTRIVISKWLSEIQEISTFTRLSSVRSVMLSSGVVSWVKSSVDTDKYYVYFEDEDTQSGYYKQIETLNNFIVASDYIGDKSKFYVAVEAIANDDYIIPAKKIYITDRDNPNKNQLVYKNEINSKLKLAGGSLFFDWDPNGDFVQKVNTSSTYEDAVQIASGIVFTYPFSFRLLDLVGSGSTVGGTLKLRFRFTNLESGTTIGKTIDVDAKYLLLNLLEDATIRDNIISLSSAVSSIQTLKKVYDNFITWMDNGTHGISNENVLFDDLFEMLQSGKYKAEYCLVGDNKTLSSDWIQFDNGHAAVAEQTENVVFVNEQPRVSALKVTDPTSYAINDYKVLIKKSKIWNVEAGEYVQQYAESYIMKLYNDVGTAFVFGITKPMAEYKLTLLDERGDGHSISVYTCNSSGVADEFGEYLMFYLNHNAADSLLGQLGDIITKGVYSMQIYAVGNDVSLSSKSEYFNVRFYGLGENLQMVNGKFTWATQSTGATTVVYKKNSADSEEFIEIDSSQGSTTALEFGLETSGAGLYDYIEFLTIGRVDGNKIDVDSEIFKINTLYKLYSPVVTNDKGLVAIDDSSNKEVLEQSYSDTSLFTYKIYNNQSTETSYLTFTDDERAARIVFHEPGITGISSTDGEYTYRATENSAEEFSVSAVGSSAHFISVDQPGTPYYIKTLYCVDGLGDISLNHVAVSSQITPLAAMMLDSPQNLKIERGKLTWSAVNGRDDLEINEEAQAVYRIRVNQYEKTNTAAGLVNTQVGNIQEFYTANTEFDFTNIAESSLDVDVPYYTITVQALGLNVAGVKPRNIPDEVCVNLVEGGVAYRGPYTSTYQDTELYMLTSEGVEFDEIERTKKIDSLQVVNGHLVWTYTIDDPTISIENYDLKLHYMFYVYDEQGKEIVGNWDYSRSGRVFTITFAEDAGQILAGEHTLSVYASRIDENIRTIMSYAVTIEVTKLATITEENITISALPTDSQIEVFNIASFFDIYAESESLSGKVTIDVKINEDLATFLYNKNKIYILSENREIDFPRDVLKAIIIRQNDVVNMTFQAKCTASGVGNILYGDISDVLVLQRSNWDEGSEIVWTEDQTFAWNYVGDYSLQQNVTANVAEKEGSDYILGDEKTLIVGTLYRVVETLTDKTIILVKEDQDGETVDVLYAINKEFVVGPTYIIEIKYGENDIRVYTTKDAFFVPTVTQTEITEFSVRVKLGPTNIQSNAFSYYASAEDPKEKVTLFASGDGTQSRPYSITNEQEFLNIAKRMSKQASTTTYLSKRTGLNETEETIFYFRLDSDVTIQEFSGICFKGDFQGVIDGANHQVSYTSTNIATLTNQIEISSGYISVGGSVTFSSGASLFETLSSSAIIKDLKIAAHFEKADDRDIQRSSLIAGLAITNSGIIRNVTIVEFESDFVASIAGSTIKMMYSGIASVNKGYVATITGCSNIADIVINTIDRTQLNCVAGIVSYNIASIENCSAGSSTTTNTFKVVGDSGSVSAYVAGIATINHGQNASIINCENYADITIEVGYGDGWSVYLAGIVDFTTGNQQDNTNHNYTAKTAAELGVNDLHQGEIYIPNN